MRRFAKLWPDVEVVQQLLHNLPWFHLCTIIDKAVGMGHQILRRGDLDARIVLSVWREAFGSTEEEA